MSDTHVYPLRDLQVHIYDRDCWCSPRVEDVEDSSEKIVIHNSADGREDFEQPMQSCRIISH